MWVHDTAFDDALIHIQAWVAIWLHGGTAFDDELVHILDWIVVQTRMAASDAALIHTKGWVAM